MGRRAPHTPRQRGKRNLFLPMLLREELKEGPQKTFPCLLSKMLFTCYVFSKCSEIH